MLFFLGLEEELPMNDPGGRVIHCQFRQSPIGAVRNDQSRRRHEGSLEQEIERSKKVFAFSPEN